MEKLNNQNEVDFIREHLPHYDTLTDQELGLMLHFYDHIDVKALLVDEDDEDIILGMGVARPFNQDMKEDFKLAVEAYNNMSTSGLIEPDLFIALVGRYKNGETSVLDEYPEVADFIKAVNKMSLYNFDLDGDCLLIDLIISTVPEFKSLLYNELLDRFKVDQFKTVIYGRVKQGVTDVREYPAKSFFNLLGNKLQIKLDKPQK